MNFKCYFIICTFISIIWIGFITFSLKSKLNSLQKEEIHLKTQYSESYRHHLQLIPLKQKIAKLQKNLLNPLSSPLIKTNSIEHFIIISSQAHRIKLNTFQLQPTSNQFSSILILEIQGDSLNLISLLIQWIHHFQGLFIQSLNWTINPDPSQTSIHLSFIIS